jgi:two-component system, chemotaxis family, chemotaxis protein CheY
MKILLADDDKVERAALRELIGEQPNLEILEVEDGQAALDALCDGLKPDLCIFDIRMPKIDGIELLQRMRRDPLLRALKVVMTSATRDRETILTLAKLQLTGYLLKPYDPAKSRAILQPLLASAGANHQPASRNLLAKTALVVDDDDITRSTLESMIRTERGWDVVTAKDGQDALTRLHSGLRPDLIVIDLIMPVLDGVSFVTRVREDPQLRSLKIAVVSAAQDREKIIALAALGVRTYLNKPFEQAKITALLRPSTVPEQSEAPANSAKAG